MAQSPVGSPADLTALVSSTTNSTVYPSDDALLAVLQRRFRADAPYTRLAATTLVVVNPLRTLANLNDASAEEYRRRCYADIKWEQDRKENPEDALPPHPYELAARVYLMMRRTRQSQGIVFNGVTDSGKTFASKLVTAQLLRLSCSATKREHKLAEQVRSLETLLNSFGAAKTKANGNASRHGRYLELHYNNAGRLAAAKVLTFGLDKSRLNKLAAEERTFHVFYQLLAGATHEERDTFKLDDVTSYALLASSGCYRLPGGPSSDDSIAMEELRAAMKVLGFKQKHCNAIFTLLSTILLLGNIHFSDHNGHDASFEAAHITNRSVLDDVSELLGVPSDEMEQALTTRSRFVRNELVTSLLNAEAASVQRDGLMRDLYAVLFAFVVETANHKVSPGAEELFPMHIVQLDGPGFQSRSGSSVTGSPPAGHPNNFEEFTTNLVAEITHNWITRRTFDDSAAPSAEMSTDGIALPEIVTGDNTACVELLRGSIVGSAADRKPTGLLGAMDKTVHKVRTGKAAEENDATLLSELDQFAVHGSYVSSQAAPNQPARKVFGVNHYQGSCTYAIDGFVERDLDLFDSAFVQLLRRSVNSFVAKLFAGPSLATETHPLDPNTVVTAQVSARPLRRPTALRSGDAVGALLDAHKVYGVTRQLNATISEILETMAQAGQTWTVSCLRPNDISQPNSFDTRRVKSQIRSLLLPDVVARKRSEYVAGMSFQDFCLRYSSWVIPAATAAGVTEPKEKIQAFAIGNAWRESTDYSIGRDKVWLAFGAWRRMEDRLRATEPDDAPEAGREDDDVTAAGSPSYPPGQLARGGSYLTPTGEMGGDWGEGDLGTSKPAFGESADELLLRRPSNTSDPFRTPGEERSAGGGDSIMGWGSDWDKRAYGDINPGMVGTLEKDTGVTKAIDAVEEEPTTALRRWWVALTWLVTWWIPSYLLSRCGGMKRPDVQMAWREKVTICFLIFALCVIILFYILIFGKLLCPDSNKAWNEQQLGTHAAENDFYVAVQGKVYDITKFWKNQHSDITNLPVDDTTMLQLAGQDLTPYFPIPMTVGCPGLVTQQSFALQTNANYTPTITQAVHTSGSQQSDQSSKLADENWYPDRFVPKMQTYYKGFYVWKKGSVESLGQDGSKQWAIVDGSIYDLTNYFNTIEVTTGSGTGLQDPEFMDSTVTDLFRSQAGSDVSKDFHTAINSLNSTAQSATRNCLNNVFYAGKVDFRDSARCQVQNYLLLAFSALLVATLLAKFIAALQLTPKRNPEQQDKFVICQVPCYTEGEDELRKTIDSLAGLKYDDKRKLMFVICDGMIVGSGNERPTPRIVLDILGVDPKIDPEPLMFKSVAEGSKQLNYGKVYSGLYEFEGHVVPYIVVVKCGRPSERSRPGNRGKRDTQILLMRYLNRVHFDSPMAPLELEIYHQMKNVIGIDPAFYEYVLMVDADTSVEPDSLNRLVAVTADDSRVIAICGETMLDNEEGSWWTMIQVYEYYISHHLAKAFESLFGSVTCLPGCFSMYRIRSADKGRPLFISNRMIDDYSENRVDTLHKKNLLSLGEDRYLTTLILKHFPAFRTKFTPDAHAHTAAPDRWGILLSQRRRWINSTIHNLAELVLMPELCGFCLFSMRFIVFIDLLGTIILPATVVYLLYLIIEVSTGAGQFPLISIIMIGATYGLQAIIFLLKRQWQYIGWMLIYILAYPIYSFFLPIYSFWHMDDFSWGNTRIVVGEKGNKKIVAGTDDEPYDDSMIPLKKFSEYQRDVWDAGSIRSGLTGQSGSPFGNPPGMQSGPPSMYKGMGGGSVHGGGSHAGSDYGGADYYQNTNVLASRPHSRQMSGNMSGYAGSHGPSRMPSMAFGAGAPPQSMYGMPGVSTPPSMYGMPAVTGSMYGMPAASQSMYGMPPASVPAMYGMPTPGGGFTHSPSGSDGGQQRMSTMSLQQQSTGGGMWGMGAGSVSRPMSTFSSGNLFGAPSPSLAQLTANPTNAPTDDEIVSAVRTYLSSQPNLMNVTKRSAREAVIASFPNADLTDRKAFINEKIDSVLAGAS